MDPLLSVLDGDVKPIERNKIFSAATLRNLIRNFGNSQLVIETDVFNIKQIYIFLKFQQRTIQV